ncbi:MAG: ABC transporter permease subunit [Desulfobacterales bacterium]|nr:ABC transporter permease subunit [Desulfobacterales bacterium]
MRPGTIKDKLLICFSWMSALLLTCGLTLIIGFLLMKGGPSLSLDLIFTGTSVKDALLLNRQVFGGLFPAMAGTVFLVLISVGIALPTGLFAGIWLAEYAPLPLKKIFSFIMDILAGVPSIVVGLFGFSITIFLHHYFDNRIYPCLLISALSLAFLVLPYIVKTTQGAIENLPLHTRLTAPSLGASKLQNILYVLLPASLSDIVSSIILAVGRCAEDTAVIMLTGVVATAGVPRSVFSSFEALPFYIYYTASEYADQSELIKGYGAALILLLICTGLFALAHIIKHWITRKTGCRS